MQRFLQRRSIERARLQDLVRHASEAHVTRVVSAFNADGKTLACANTPLTTALVRVAFPSLQIFTPSFDKAWTACLSIASHVVWIGRRSTRALPSAVPDGVWSTRPRELGPVVSYAPPTPAILKPPAAPFTLKATSVPVPCQLYHDLHDLHDFHPLHHTLVAMPGGVVAPLELVLQWQTDAYPHGIRAPPTLTIVSVIFTALALAITLARLYDRAFVRHNAGVDDLLVAIALVCCKFFPLSEVNAYCVQIPLIGLSVGVCLGKSNPCRPLKSSADVFTNSRAAIWLRSTCLGHHARVGSAQQKGSCSLRQEKQPI